METLEHLLAGLSEVHGRLLALPDDAFAERYALLLQRDALRDKVAEHHQGFDESRSTEDLIAELDALRDRARLIEKDRIDVVKQHGGGSWGAAAGADGWGAVQLNASIEEAQGLPKIRTRIGRIKGILMDRETDVTER
ncbi:MAG: hypothetical protein HKN93_03565 [Acidimicrobiia bacterium]|nr:hypothetical protein [Acidimicrobiia bacterium]